MIKKIISNAMSIVKAFGAVGDGKIDDSLAIRRAFSDADGQLKFPRGNYLISKPPLSPSLRPLQ